MSLASRLPDQYGDLAASVYFASGILTAVFHQVRTGEGQRVETSLNRAGLFAAATMYSLTAGSPYLINFFRRTEETLWEEYPAPSMHCHKLKDGMWVQLLHPPQTLLSALKRFDLSWTFYPSLMCRLMTNVFLKKGTLLDRLLPVFGYVNRSIQNVMATMTWDEFQALALERDIWYAPVNMPAQAKKHPQAQALSIVTDCKSQSLVASTFISSVSPSAHLPRAVFPALGEHNAILE